jgi:hypothetical protein
MGEHARNTRTLHLLLWTFAGVLTTVLSPATDSRPPLRFRGDGTFKILQLADLHYGHSEEADAHTDKARAWLDDESRHRLSVL